jgi:hypothetical protein
MEIVANRASVVPARRLFASLLEKEDGFHLTRTRFMRLISGILGSTWFKPILQNGSIQAGPVLGFKLKGGSDDDTSQN